MSNFLRKWSSAAGLRQKFLIASIGQSILVAVIILAADQFLLRRALVRETGTQVAVVADTVEATAGYYVALGLSEDLKSIIRKLAADPRIHYADFVAKDGSIIAATSESLRPVAFAASPSTRLSSRVKENGVMLQLAVRPFYEMGAASGGGAPVGYFRMAANEGAAMHAARAQLPYELLVLALIVIGAALLANAWANLMIGPIVKLAENAAEVANGNLTIRSKISSDDEIGRLGEAYNAMTSNLESIIGRLAGSQRQLSSAVDTVGMRSQNVITAVDQQSSVVDEAYTSIDQMNSGIRKISDNVELLSTSSEETSSSILEMVASMEEVSRHTDTLFSSVEETSSATHQMVSSINEVDQNIDFLQNFVTETSSSMTEMSASISQVETNSARSYDLSLVVADAAQTGMRAVRETIDGMEQIRQAVLDATEVISRLGERSFEIGKILNVIDDVAEQTNLLALNAAILAAQAGEHGKGFSVVAAQIRDLSERTGRSTKEIATLIKSVQSEVANASRSMTDGSRIVEGGVTLAHDAGRALNNILDSSTKSSEMNKEIANATRDQAAGSENVARSVEKVQEMVRQIYSPTRQQATGSDHILKAVESMREVTRYVRQAMVEQKSGSVMISRAAERMIDMVHEIFQVSTDQATGSENIVRTMQQVREIAESNRKAADEMNQTVALLRSAIRGVDEEIRRFTIS